MSSSTLTLLQNSKTQTDLNPAEEIFIADENIEDAVILMQFARAMPVITNRYHIFAAIQQTGSHHLFNDFDFSSIKDASLQRIYYRTSKEKPVVHHVINAATRLLKPGGELIIVGEKHQGIQTYIKKAEQRLGGTAVTKKDGPARIAVIKNKMPGPALDDSDYPTLRPAITTDNIIFYSKPGVFGWNKVDQGSQFLASHLAALNLHDSKLLDLGCGYGYLAVMAQKYSPATTHASDNNAAALLACKKNFALHNISGEVIADNIGAALTPGYDVILCNPPFHQGFDVERGLTLKFVAACANLLTKKGRALFVVNSFIALEKVATNYFNKVEIIANNNQFKLVLLSEPRTPANVGSAAG